MSKAGDQHSIEMGDFIMRYVNCILAGVLFFFIPIAALAGSLDDPGAPGSNASKMYTLENIYQRLSNNTQASDPQTGSFTEPGSAPTEGTGHTLNDVYGKAIPTQAPKTGQSDCYWDNGSTGTCTCGTTNCPSGQDGDLEKGVEWPSTRFTASNGTVTDKLTGLIWLQNADVPEAQRTWAQAFSDVAELNSGGTMNEGKSSGDTSNGGSHQIDWRLPNVEELSSLIDFGRFGPALPEGHPFANVQSSIYWTSTTRADKTYFAWHVSLFNGNASYATKSNSTAYVWPVRGGQQNL